MSIHRTVLVLGSIFAMGNDAEAQPSEYNNLSGCTVTAVQYGYWPDGNRGDGALANVEKLWFSVTGCAGAIPTAGIAVMTGHPEVGAVRTNGGYLVPASVFQAIHTTVREAFTHGWRVAASGENLRVFSGRLYQLHIEAPRPAPVPPSAPPPKTAPKSPF